MGDDRCLPRSLANIKREMSEKNLAGDWIAETKHRMPEKQRPNSTVAECSKRLAGRFHQLMTGTVSLGNTSDGRKTGPPRSCPYTVQTREHTCSRMPANLGFPAQVTGWSRDERCTGAVLDFLRTTRVGARTGPPDPGGERGKGSAQSP